MDMGKLNSRSRRGVSCLGLGIDTVNESCAVKSSSQFCGELLQISITELSSSESVSLHFKFSVHHSEVADVRKGKKGGKKKGKKIPHLVLSCVASLEGRPSRLRSEWKL